MDYLPDLIRSARARRGLDQTKAAARVGVSQQTWSKWERGITATIRDANLPKLAKFMGVSVDELEQAIRHQERAVRVDDMPAPAEGSDVAKLREKLDALEATVQALREEQAHQRAVVAQIRDAVELLNTDDDGPLEGDPRLDT